MPEIAPIFLTLASLACAMLVAGLLWPRHLADYQALDLFSAETDHHAAGRRFTDQPLVAYRLAESVQRPYAATASGGRGAGGPAWAVPALRGASPCSSAK